MQDAAMIEQDGRENVRTNMYVAAVLRGSTTSTAVKLRNMSALGALVEGPTVPDAGARVHLLRGSLSVGAEVVWSVEGRCGLRFSSIVCVREWLAAPVNKHQQTIDCAVAAVKAGAVPLGLGRSRCADGKFNPDCSAEQLADDLTAACRLFEALGDILADDADVIERHAGQLQNLDIALQMTSVVASRLTGRGADDSAGASRLRDLRTSCAEALASTR